MATRIRAPEFPDGFDWIGTPRPLKLAELRGQVVVLDFWTYCCVNCIHVLPVLAALEEKRREDPVVVIGVHSAKFSGEADAARIRDAVARYGIKHPVIVDVDHRIWQSYTIRSWPTLVVIRPDGSIAAVAPGEADLDALDAFVQGVIGDAREDGTLAVATARTKDVVTEAETPPDTLAFPGKVIALPGDRLAVSDSGHHRVVVLGLDGRVEVVIGSGAAGLRDGSVEDSSFRSPQGLAYDPETDVLFVADTGNHAIREVEIDRGRVRTTAGTGTLGRVVPRVPVAALALPLRSPWDLVVAGDYVLVAMAGAHQIWAYSRPEETMGVFAGSGREGIADGVFAEAAFAQPSGLALDGTKLYVADGETSAVRCLDLVEGRVRTLVGTGLFDFGDVDGPRATALLQHPTGIATGPAGLLVADTYNNKVKRIDAEAGGAETVFEKLGDLALREPAGLCQLEDGRVVVADTNHHGLVVLSADGGRAERLAVRPVAAAPSVTTAGEDRNPVRTLRRIDLERGDATLRLRVRTPEGFSLAQGSRVSVRVDAGPHYVAPQGDLGFEVTAAGRGGIPVLLKAAADGDAEGAFTVALECVLCGHGPGAACWPVGVVYRVPFRTVSAGPVAADLSLPVPVPSTT